MPENPDFDLLSFIQRLPKTETHLHIEGALPFELLQRLDSKRFATPPQSWDSDFKFESFQQFEDELLDMALLWYTSPERYQEAARVIFDNLVSQNVKYLETSFHAGVIETLGIPGPEIMAAIIEAVPKGLEVRVFLGMLRNHYNEKMAPILSDCINWKGLSGIDLHGVEVLPIEPWAEELWGESRRVGLKTKAHAGEFGGADYVEDAIHRLGVRRIEHGVRAVEDPNVVRKLVQLDVTLDICPISNIKLGVTPTIGQHPIRRLYDAGVRCTVSTDDPLSFGNRLTDEYVALSSSFNRKELALLARNGFEIALLEEEKQSSFLENLDEIIALED